MKIPFALRFSHWIGAICACIAWILSDFDEAIYLHTAFGACVLMGAISVITGFTAYGVEENSGVFAFLPCYYGICELTSEAHELSSNALSIIVGTHICGALIDHFWLKNSSLKYAKWRRR